AALPAAPRYANAPALAPAAAGARPGLRSSSGFAAVLQRIEQHPRDIQPELAVEFADAGRAGDVDLGEPVADHVQADEAHAAPFHLGTDLGGDPAVALAQGTALAAAAGSQVAAELVALRDPRQAVVHRDAVDQQDALVAVDDLGQVALRHGQMAPALGEGFQNHVEVGVAGAGAEDRAPAHAVQRLEHRVAVLSHERLERGGLAADHGRRAALREFERGQLLVH